MNFDHCNRSLKIQESIGTPTPKMGASFTPSYTPMSMKCDSQASFSTHTFASPYLNHKPKVRVTTTTL
jgi:hypothetical protein